MKRAALLFSLSLASTFLIARSGEAQVLASFESPSVFGSQDNSLGYAFSSSQSTSITALGFWDNNSDGFSADHQVGLWDAAGALLGLVNLSQGTGNTLIDGFRYADLASSVTLNAGATYFLAGTTLGDN